MSWKQHFLSFLAIHARGIFLWFVRPSVFSQRQISELAHQFSIIFCMTLQSHKLKNVMDCDFWEKIGTVKDLKMARKWDSWVFYRNPIYLHTLFKIQYESTNCLVAFCENHIFYWEKSGSSSYCPKTSRLIRMQDSLNYNVSQMSWVMKMNSFMGLDFHKSSIYSWSLQLVWSGMPGHIQSDDK